MAKVWAASAALLLAVAFFAWVLLRSPSTQSEAQSPVGKSSSNQPAPPPKSWASFVDPAGYQVRYPTDWQLRDHTQKDGLIRADLDHGSTGLQIRLLRKVSAETADAYLEHYLRQFTQDMQGHWGGWFEELHRSCGPMGKHRGCSAGLSHHRGDGQVWFLKQYVWIHQSNAVVMQAGSTMAERDEAEKQLDAIATTLVFEPPP